VAAPDRLGHLAPDHFQVRKLAAVQLGAGDGAALHHVIVRPEVGAEPRVGRVLCAGWLRVGGLGVVDVNELVLGELGVNLHVQQPALAAVCDFRYAANWLGELAVSEDSEPAGLFGDQQPAVGEERHAPGVVELGQRLDIYRPRLGLHRRRSSGCCKAAHGRQRHARRGAEVIHHGERSFVIEYTSYPLPWK
jgi:hypothetical protein